MQEVLKQIVGHHLADALEADEFEKLLRAAEITTHHLTSPHNK